jgi:hypothetical protein
MADVERASPSSRRKPGPILIFSQERKWIPAFAGMTADAADALDKNEESTRFSQPCRAAA